MADVTETGDQPNAPVMTPPTRIYRHRLATRLWHWINAVSVIVLLGSGLMILNAHPHLYWGQFGANFDEPWFSVSMVFADGRVPGWLTIPSNYSLSAGRRWHLFFALVLGPARLHDRQPDQPPYQTRSDRRARGRVAQASGA